MLGRLLAQQPDDKQVLVDLYLRCLAREPRPAELATCQEHLASVAQSRYGLRRHFVGARQLDRIFKPQVRQRRRWTCESSDKLSWRSAAAE